MKQDKTPNRSAILITHGTDTLAWTHAAVRYAVKGNIVNIAITGSQIPMPDGVGDFSDAYANIGNSIRFLTQFTPPHIFTVFNNGQNAFSDSLYKINRWDNHAFEGDLIGTMQWDEVHFHDEVIEISDTPQSLDTLYVVTTGGTIESTFNENGVLSPQQDRLSTFIKTKFDNPDTNIIYKPACVIDSSDLTFDKMKAVIEKVKECFEEIDPESKAVVDLAFDQDVRIIFTDPFKTEERYRQEIEGVSAIVIAGYGGGNVNIDGVSGFSPLNLIKEISPKIPVVLTSQVALGPADFIYENAWEAIVAGAISGVDLSIPEIQMRLSYLMGHKNEINAFCKSHGYAFKDVFEWLFMSGMKFRTNRSRRVYEQLRNTRFHKKDLLINYTFDESLEFFKNRETNI